MHEGLTERWSLFLLLLLHSIHQAVLANKVTNPYIDAGSHGLPCTGCPGHPVTLELMCADRAKACLHARAEPAAAI